MKEGSRLKASFLQCRKRAQKGTLYKGHECSGTQKHNTRQSSQDIMMSEKRMECETDTREAKVTGRNVGMGNGFLKSSCPTIQE